MRTIVEPINVTRAGRAIDTETTACAIGPHVVVVCTAVPSLGVQVTTTYVGADDAETVAVDLVLAPRPAARNQPRSIPRDSIPVTHAREQCLLDHAQQLMNVLRIHDRQHYTVDVSDDAVAQAAAI